LTSARRKNSLEETNEPSRSQHSESVGQEKPENMGKETPGKERMIIDWRTACPRVQGAKRE